MRRLGLLVLTAMLAACASPVPSASSTLAASDGTYSLSIQLGQGPFHAADAIDLTATLAYLGSAGSATVTGPDSGLVAFEFERLDGGLRMLPNSRLMCSAPATIQAGQPLAVRPVKMAGWSSGDPNASFYAAWIADPDLHLPVGRWRITASAWLYDGTDCAKPSPDHDLTTSRIIDVQE